MKRSPMVTVCFRRTVATCLERPISARPPLAVPPRPLSAHRLQKVTLPLSQVEAHLTILPSPCPPLQKVAWAAEVLKLGISVMWTVRGYEISRGLPAHCPRLLTCPTTSS